MKYEFILIDAAAELSDIQARTEDMKPLGVILTHGHFDHFENLEEIMNFYNVKCYITESEFEKLLNPKLNYSIIFNKFITCKQPKENFVILGEKEEFELGSFKIKTFITKGHTNGSICIDVNETLFTGDTKFARTYGRTDLLTGSEEEMQESLKYLDDNYKGRLFYPGHGRVGEI